MCLETTSAHEVGVGVCVFVAYAQPPSGVMVQSGNRAMRVLQDRSSVVDWADPAVVSGVRCEPVRTK